MLMRLLEKNPNNRITAEQALRHEYFSKEFEMTSVEDDSESMHQHQPPLSRKSSIPHSPLMTSADPLRKKKDRLREDSLMKFKMQENVMTGKT
jgi:serine/threonine protein kinase